MGGHGRYDLLLAIAEGDIAMVTGAYPQGWRGGQSPPSLYGCWPKN